MKVQDWELEALYAGFPMNRRLRRAAMKIEREFETKIRGYAREGSKRAQETLEEFRMIGASNG